MNSELIIKIVGVLGTIGVFVGIVQPLGWIGVALCVGVAFLVLIYEKFALRKRTQLDMSGLDSIVFRHALPSDIPKIVALDRRSFDDSEVIPAKTFSKWRDKNSQAFTCIICCEEVVGYFSILPLAEKTMNLFVAGKIREHEFVPQDILSVEDAAKSESDWYFFSIVVLPEYRYYVDTVIARILHVLKQKKEAGCIRRLYATGATHAGEVLLTRFGFLPVEKGINRADGHDLYVKDIKSVQDFIALASVALPQGHLG